MRALRRAVETQELYYHLVVGNYPLSGIRIPGIGQIVTIIVQSIDLLRPGFGTAVRVQHLVQIGSRAAVKL